MAQIAPFLGLRYNPLQVPDLNQVVTPPYDVISPAEQESFHRLSPHNMIHLELGMRHPEDDVQHNAHSRAATQLKQWQEENVLIRESRPAIYYYALDYALSPGLRQTRYGFVCALRLEDFRSGCVRPHERTFQAVKDERLQLMLACRANLSPVFALYDDPSQVIDHSLRDAREPKAVIDYEDGHAMRHRLWRVLDVRTLHQVHSLMRDKAIFIADGHHRYETALAYRDLLRGQHPRGSERAAFEYIMVYLSNMHQAGLTILPTHRLLRHLGAWEPDGFLGRTAPFFEQASFEMSAAAPEGPAAAWEQALRWGRAQGTSVIGFYWKDAERFILLKARQAAVAAFLGERGVPEVLRGVDVVILDEVLLRHLMGLSEPFLANENNIHFKHDFLDGLSQVQQGSYDAGFFISPTRIEQVQAVASAGLIMPHKSTYFFPKVFSGLVLNLLLPHEELLW
jgi:uncharacterized protein (DUF1015 family)